MEKDYPKFQYSQFDKLEGQYVVRTDDQEEFKKLVQMVKMATGQAFATTPVTQNSAPSATKSKRAYKHAGDTCMTCNRGVYVVTTKMNKEGEKYYMLICDQKGCTGDAYISKFPKVGQPEEVPTIQIEDTPF